MIRISRRRRAKYERREKDIDPDEIFIDSHNLPNFDTHQFEGRIEKSISRRSLFILTGAFLLIFLIFIGRIWALQIQKGDFYFTKSENNRLRHSLIFAQRGIIYDRIGTELAWNVENPADPAFASRKYIALDGFAHLLGYLKYPTKDKYGFYFTEVFQGIDGVEKFYDAELSGENGKRIVEVNASDEIQSENIIRVPQDGEDIKLAVDAGVQAKMHEAIKELAGRVGFVAGAGVIMDVRSGEVLALTSFPEFNSQILTDGADTAAINKYRTDAKNPFLDRVIDGVYAPGSTVKPYMAFAALNENIIDPLKNILSTGALILPNRFDPTKPSVFKDWKAHGYVDMREALAVSSDVYFYEIGGGFEDQKGLGIANVDKYMKMFGFGSSVKSPFFAGASGVVPTPEWKKANFEGEEWNIGNTYHTSIGQYGFQVAPIQLVRAVGAIGNGGKLIEPTLLLGENNKNNFTDLHLNQDYLQIVREGMRDGVTQEYGVARGLHSGDYTVAAKTGTAELGASKQFVNSWITGFFPYENPKYAFVIVMERGPVANTTGALSVMRQVLDYMALNKSEYLH